MQSGDPTQGKRTSWSLCLPQHPAGGWQGGFRPQRGRGNSGGTSPSLSGEEDLGNREGRAGQLGFAVQTTREKRELLWMRTLETCPGSPAGPLAHHSLFRENQTAVQDWTVRAFLLGLEDEARVKSASYWLELEALSQPCEMTAIHPFKGRESLASLYQG